MEIIIGAGVTNEGESNKKKIKRVMVRFFAIFSTDGVSTYSCNVSATGIVKSGSGDDEDDDDTAEYSTIEIVSLSCAKDEGLGRTFDLI